MTVFTHTDPELLNVLEELKQREPIFHTPRFGMRGGDFDKAMALDYWEVGASGRRYSRDFILRYLAGGAIDAEEAGWRSSDHSVRRLGPNTYLFTYTLQQGERLTRRATIWEFHEGLWRILYHQGTVVSTNEDDTAPPKDEVAHPIHQRALSRTKQPTSGDLELLANDPLL